MEQEDIFDCKAATANTTDQNITKAARKPSLWINVLSNWASLIVNVALSFLLTPFLIAHLGQENFGIWALCLSVVGYYGLLQLGVGAGIMRYVPYYKGLGDQRAVSEVMSTAMGIFLFVGLIIFSISVLVARPIAQFFKGGEDFVWLIRILGIAAVLECPMQVLDACVRAHERWVAANMVAIINVTVRTLGLVFCLTLGYGLVGMGYVILSVGAFSLVVVGVLFMWCCKGIKLRPSLIRLNCVKSLIWFGIFTNVGALVYTLRLAGHNIIVGKVISVAAVGLYAVPVTIIKNVRLATVMPTRVFWPRFAMLDGEDQRDEVKQFMFKTTKFCAVIASWLILMVLTLGPSFIRLWIKKDDYSAASPLLIVLACGYLIEASLGSTVPFLCGTGHQKAQAAIAAVEGILGFGLSILLGIKIGLIGVPIGFLIGSVIVNGIVSTWYVSRLLKTGFLTLYSRCILRPWILLGLLTFAVYFSGLNKITNNWPGLIGAAAGLSIAYVLSLYIFVLDNAERTKVNAAVRRFFIVSLKLLKAPAG